MKQKIKPLPLTWHTATHTGTGFQAAMEFLETTGVGSRTWIFSPNKDLVGGYGWSHIRDNGEGVEEEVEGERGREIEAVEAVGVG